MGYDEWTVTLVSCWRRRFGEEEFMGEPSVSSYEAVDHNFWSSGACVDLDWL